MNVLEDILCFFSSDSRPLYKADIYAAMSLPNKYVVHFRYKEKYIQPDILNKIELLKFQRGVIFFAKSQHDDHGVLKHQTENISIREIMVIDLFKDDETNLYHFYLRLQDFIDYTIQINESRQPPHLFLAFLKGTKGSKNKWIDRVQEIRSSFGTNLFINLQFRDKGNGNKMLPRFDASEYQSMYYLSDEKEYLIDIIFAQTEDVTKKRENKYPVLIIEDTSNNLLMNVSEFIDIGVNHDRRTVRLTTKSLSSVKIDSHLVFKIGIYDNAQHKIEKIIQSFPISARITKNYLSTLLFSFYSVLTALGLTSIAVFNLSLKDKPNYNAFVFGILSLAISSGMMYKMFNKK